MASDQWLVTSDQLSERVLVAVSLHYILKITFSEAVIWGCFTFPDMERIILDLRCPPMPLQAHLKGILSGFLHPLLHLKAAELGINNLAIRNQ